MINRFKFILLILLLIYKLNIESYSTIDKYEIDKQAAVVAVELGGGLYDEDVEAIIPLDPNTIHQEWKQYRHYIAKKIGKIEPTASQKNQQWQNTADSIDELVNDAQTVAPDFCNFCAKIAKSTHSTLNFGPGNVHYIKNKESLENKVFEDAQKEGISIEEAVAKIGDAVRGTLITDSPKKIAQIVKKIKSYVKQYGGKVFFRNYWVEEKESGYIGIHAKLLLPVRDDLPVLKKRFILAELQIHLDCIMDGSEACVKERGHLLYKKEKGNQFDLALRSYASKLLYLTALKEYHKHEDQLEETFN